MRDDPGVGPQALRKVAEIWKADDVSARWRRDGFDWWPGDFKVSVQAIRRLEQYGPEMWFLKVTTDFLKDVPIDDPRFVRLASVTSRILASTHAWVYQPAEAWAHYKRSGQIPADAVPRLWFSNTAYVTADNANWLPEFLAWMSAVQPVNAQIQSKIAPNYLTGGIPDVSLADGARAAGRHPMLEIVAQVYAPIGRETNRWIGTDEFSGMAQRWASDQIHGAGDANGLTLETSFGSDAALFKLRTDQNHPQLGTGLLATLQVPMFFESTAAANESAGLNLVETFWTDLPQFGCWHPYPSLGGQEGLAFSTFVPNALYGPGIATQIGLWMLRRARWLREQRHPNAADKPIREILKDRTK